jgi:hypothetical protein
MASASSPETLLQSALIALKQKDYGTAIATFSTLQHHGNASTAQRLKAEMGLVRAYVGQGETATAIALCERLRQRPQPQVQAWASRMLADLPVAATSDGQVGQDASGFRPLAANSGPTGLAEEARNASGFRPLTADGGADVSELPPLTPPQSTDPSGFVPLADDPAPPVTPSPSVDSLPPATAAPVAPPPPAPPTADPSAPSLFHYASLNQAGMAAATESYGGCCCPRDIAPDSATEHPPASTPGFPGGQGRCARARCGPTHRVRPALATTRGRATGTSPVPGGKPRAAAVVGHTTGYSGPQPGVDGLAAAPQLAAVRCRAAAYELVGAPWLARLDAGGL